MKQGTDKNKNAVLQSYDQFYAQAYKAIFNTLPGSHRHGLSETIVDSLTQFQINQYNLIELQTFELNKEIKSKLSRFDQSQVSAMMIRIRNVMQELQRMCCSLKIKFVFDLFQKISTCLIMMASLNLAKNEKQKPKNLNNSDVNESKQKQIRKKSDHRRNGESICVKKGEQQSLMLRSKKSSKLQRMKLGGVSLYNENYKKNIENKHYVCELNQTLGERARFWKQLQNNYKETLGTTMEAIENKKQQTCNRKVNIDRQNQISQQQNESEKYRMAFLNLSNDKTVELKAQFKVKDQSTFAQNAESILNNYEQLCCELNSFDFSDEGIQKIIEDVSGVYKKQKIITLDSLKKVFTRFWCLHQQRSQKMVQIVKRQVEINKIMESRLMKKLQNMKQVEVQTIPCIALSKQKQECEKLKNELNILEKVQKGLQQVIMKQHRCIALLQKANGEKMKKLEFKQKLCRQYEQKLCNAINNKQNKVEIQSKRWSLYQFDSSRKNVIEKDSIKFNQHQHELHSYKAQKQIITNTNISAGFSSQCIPSKLKKNSEKHIHFNIDQSKSGQESHSDYSLTKLNIDHYPILQSKPFDISKYRNDTAKNSRNKKIIKNHSNRNNRFSQKRSEKALEISKIDLNKTFLQDHLNIQQNKLKLCSIVCSINLQPSLLLKKNRSLKYAQNIRKCSMNSQKSLLSKKKKQLTWRHTSRNDILMSQKTMRYEKSQQKQTTSQYSLKSYKILNSKKQKVLSILKKKKERENEKEKENENLTEIKYNIDKSRFQNMRLSSHQSQKYISYVSQLKQKYQGKQLTTNQLCQRRFPDKDDDDDEDENKFGGMENQGLFNVVQAQLPKKQLLIDEKAGKIKISHQNQPLAINKYCDANILNKIKSANSQNFKQHLLKEQKIKKICNSKLNQVVHYAQSYFLSLQQTIKEQSDMQGEQSSKIEVSQNDQSEQHKQSRKELRATVPNNSLYDLPIGKIRVARKQYRKPCNRKVMNAKKVMLNFENSQTED